MRLSKCHILSWQGGLVSIGVSLALPVLISPAYAEPTVRPTLSFFGTPGYVDLPSGEPLPDADIAISTGVFYGIMRNTATFQISPRVTGSFRYAVHGAKIGEGQNFDRSFDISYLFAKESQYLPSLSVGMRDFAGTSVYSSEYIAATKHISDRLVVTGGLGWGRLAGKPRPLVGSDGIHSYRYWFSGKPAFFGAARWKATDRLTIMAEYSKDEYTNETALFGFTHKSPFSFGANYRTQKNWDLGLYYLYGSEIGFKASYFLNPKAPRISGGREGAPPLVAHRSGVVKSWGARKIVPKEIQEHLNMRLAQHGLRLEATRISDTKAIIWVRNERYGATAQAIGRSARIMTQVLPDAIEDFIIVPVINGIPTAQIALKRSNLEALEWAPGAGEKMRKRVQISDAAQYTKSTIDWYPDAYPEFNFKFGGYLSPSLFDPDAPIRADFGVQFSAHYSPYPGLIFSGSVRKPLVGNLNKSTRISDSVLPHVRSDGAEYDRKSDLELSHLTAEYFFRPAKNLYGRITAGYLERMYGGVSAEILWKPINRNLAVGAEINYVQKRDFNVGFGFQDYKVATGHVSGYYQFPHGYHAQIDAGRYLAGDWGATAKFGRRFANGWRVGIFATLTDVPFGTFGEGAFDKGIYFHVPHEWLTGDPSHKGYAGEIHLINRDGGARLDVRNRLYDVVSGFQDPALSKRWGRFWR